MDDSRRQFCWAHLLRAVQKHLDREGLAGVLGKRLMRSAVSLFRSWYWMRDGTLSRAAFQQRVRQPGGCAGIFEQDLDCVVRSDEHRLKQFCKELLARRECR